MLYFIYLFIHLFFITIEFWNNFVDFRKESEWMHMFLKPNFSCSFYSLIDAQIWPKFRLEQQKDRKLRFQDWYSGKEKEKKMKYI